MQQIYFIDYVMASLTPLHLFPSALYLTSLPSHSLPPWHSNTPTIGRLTFCPHFKISVQLLPIKLSPQLSPSLKKRFRKQLGYLHFNVAMVQCSYGSIFFNENYIRNKKPFIAYRLYTIIFTVLKF